MTVVVSLNRRISPSSVSRGTTAKVLASILFALFLSGFSILLHLISQPLAITFCVLSSVALAIYFEQYVPTVLFVCLIFQSTFISLASTRVHSAAELIPMKSYDFLIAVCVWLVIAAPFFFQRRVNSPLVRNLFYLGCLILLVATVYFLLGLRYNARNSVIYMRNVSTPVMLFQICLLCSCRHAIPMRTISTVILCLLIVCGYMELLDRKLWLDVTNGWRYFDLSLASQMYDPYLIKQMQQGGIVVANPLDLLKTNFLNMNLFGQLGYQIVRLQGPNFHPISYGYSLAAFMTFCALHKRKALFVLAVPLLLFASAKGAIVMTLVCLLVTIVSDGRFRRMAAPLLIIGLSIYAFLVFVSGRASGDFHVLGLLGGINGFLRQPWGRTLGQGGNLSTNFAKLDWSKFQHVGAANTALESAIGVMLYQMGVAAIPIILTYVSIARTCWRIHETSRIPVLAMCASGIAVMLVNGIFQEEALFAPLAMGLIMAFTGLALGAVDRVQRRQQSNWDDGRRTAPGPELHQAECA